MKKVELINTAAGFKRGHKFDAKKAENFLFENHKFINCKFYGVDFTKLNIKMTTFKNCLFEECIFDNMTISEKIFEGNVVIIKFDKCRFNECEMCKTTFENIHFSECVFFECPLLIEAEFINCSAEKSKIYYSPICYEVLREIHKLKREEYAVTHGIKLDNTADIELEAEQRLFDVGFDIADFEELMEIKEKLISGDFK